MGFTEGILGRKIVSESKGSGGEEGKRARMQPHVVSAWAASLQALGSKSEPFPLRPGVLTAVSRKLAAA